MKKILLTIALISFSVISNASTVGCDEVTCYKKDQYLIVNTSNRNVANYLSSNCVSKKMYAEGGNMMFVFNADQYLGIMKILKMLMA
jgi:hypothetical protein